MSAYFRLWTCASAACERIFKPTLFCVGRISSVKPFFGKSPIRKGLSQTCGGRKQTKRNTTTNELCKWRFLSLEINGHHHKKQQNSLKSTTRIFIPQRSLTARLPQKHGGKGRTIQFLLGFGNFSAVNSLLNCFFFWGGVVLFVHECSNVWLLPLGFFWNNLFGAPRFLGWAKSCSLKKTTWIMKSFSL